MKNHELDEFMNSKEFLNAQKFVLENIQKNNYPSNHPFLEYPDTPEGMGVFALIFFKFYGMDDDIIVDMIKKCKSIEHERFDYDRYRQNFNEVIFLYYVINSTFINNNLDYIKNILYQDNTIFDNNKIPEYSLEFFVNDEKILMNIEVKTLSCEALPDGKKIDGQKLVLPYYKDINFIEQLKSNYQDAIVLEDKCCLYQLERNIKKIAAKFDGENLLQYKLFNVGVIFIDRATSMEQFYSYLFNEKFGVYRKTNFGNIDALILITLDAKVDLLMSNIYNSEYIQTILINDSEINKQICEELRLDNYILIGNEINEYVFEKSENEFEVLKILKREGFINIIPYDATEDDINNYLEFLLGDTPRNSSM